MFKSELGPRKVELWMGNYPGGETLMGCVRAEPEGGGKINVDLRFQENLLTLPAFIGVCFFNVSGYAL